MKNFLVRYQDLLLTMAAFVFAGLIVWFYAWGIAELTKNVNSALNPPPPAGESAGFDFAGFEQLNLGE